MLFRSVGGARRVYWEVKTPLRASDGTILGLVGISADITAAKAAEEERAQLRDQLASAQRLESIGRLAGGVAHDFNNMLNVVISHAELAREEAVVPGVRESLEQILGAARRSAALTSQLLAFARRQPVVPRPLELNDTVARMLQMLRRLLGEDLELEWRPAAHPVGVHMDPSQIDQVMTNLCVNARDASSGAGRVTIATGVTVLDEAGCAGHIGATPGEYAVLSVRDSGHGMTPEVRARIFEPFFTTKEQGRGTGLGLATVMGIVSQNGGFIDVISAPGAGTTFRVHLPLREAPGRDDSETLPPVVTPPPEPGGETILVVEDEAEILHVTQRILERRGYVVLAASSPESALVLARAHQGMIDMVISDVIMPGMNGRELVTRLRQDRPGLRSLFMSGYTADHIAHHGMLEPGVNFLQKPFSPADLLARVRAIVRATVNPPAPAP